MTSMDKRQPGALGRPMKMQNIYVVVRKSPDNGDVSVERIFTSMPKACHYIDQTLCSDSGVRLDVQKWRVE